jgi:hypothetical protein
MQERLARDKHSSLLVPFVSYKEIGLSGYKRSSLFPPQLCQIVLDYAEQESLAGDKNSSLLVLL